MDGRSEQGVAFEKQGFRSRLLCFFYGGFAEYRPDAFALRFGTDGKFRQLIVILRVVHLAEGAYADRRFLVGRHENEPALVDDVFLRMVEVVQIVRLHFPMLLNPILVQRFEQFLVARLVGNDRYVRFLTYFPRLLHPLQQALFCEQTLPLVDGHAKGRGLLPGTRYRRHCLRHRTFP